MPPDILDRRDYATYVGWLRARRTQALVVATALAQRAADQDRALTPGEHAQFSSLTEAINRLDRRLRVAWIDSRADPGYRPSLGTWARDNGGGSFATAPGSGDRSTLASLRGR